jgi:hypothetical protein
MGIRVMEAPRRRPTDTLNFYFENGKIKKSQPREQQ